MSSGLSSSYASDSTGARPIGSSESRIALVDRRIGVYLNGPGVSRSIVVGDLTLYGTSVTAGNRNLPLLLAVGSLNLASVRLTVEVVHEDPAVPIVQDEIRAALASEAPAVFLGLVPGRLHRRHLLVAFAHHRPSVFSEGNMYR